MDIITTTMGKALGGASGGVVAGPREVIEMLRNRGRPYLFSNAVPPPIIYGALKGSSCSADSPSCATSLEWNAKYFREKMEAAGFTLVPGETPIVPVMLGDAKLANDMARKTCWRKASTSSASATPSCRWARRASARSFAPAHTRAHRPCVEAFIKVGKKHGVIA